MPAHLVLPIFVAALLPYVATVIAKAGAFGPKQNTHTREWLAKQEGYRQRANWAQQNGFETFPIFAAAVVVAGLRSEADWLLWVAWGFVAARVLYTICYLADLASLRSLVWFVGMGCSFALYIEAFLA